MKMRNDKWKMENERSAFPLKMPDSSILRLMIVAGEASGDAHGAALVRALREAVPETQFEFFGGTGAQMRAADVTSVVDTDKLAILGLWEIAIALAKFWRAYRALKQAARARRPDAVILIDWPDFNLRLARWLHRQGFRVIYYISPQLWAWRSYRARSIRRNVDLLLSILPFEKEWYARREITQVEYVGHPLAGEVKAREDRAAFCRRHQLDTARPIVALVPGSRHNELQRILPPMLDAAAIISKRDPQVQFLVVVAPNRSPAEAEQIISARTASTAQTQFRLIHNETREALAAADAAAVASGTVTLETALLGIPMVIVYKESFLNWHLLGSLIDVDHYGLPNLIAGRRIVTELMQTELNGERLSTELTGLLDPERNRISRDELQEVFEKLGAHGASRHAAEKILEFLKAN
jgi:lipid-A-disaccharide synthase